MKLPTYKSLEEKKKYFWPFIQVDTIEAFEKEFERLGTIVNHLGELPNAEKLDLVVFRGMSEAKYKLYTSAQREWITNDWECVLGKDGFVGFIESLLSHLRNNDNLKKYFSSMNIVVENNDLLLLSFLQHYRAPTPLIDFTSKKEVALFFALEGLENEKQGADDIENYFSIYVHPIHKNHVTHIDQYYNNIDEVASKERHIGIRWKTDTDSPLIVQLSAIDTYLFYIPNPTKMDKMNNRDNDSFYTWSNPNIIAQNGCFVVNPLPDESLAHLYYERNYKRQEKKEVPFMPNMKCLNIHKSLAPYIREKYLKSVTKETIYPDFKSIANEAYEAFRRCPKERNISRVCFE